jgi:uncharacterized membrane protein YgcG
MRLIVAFLSPLSTSVALGGLLGCNPSGSGTLSVPGLDFNFGRDNGAGGGNESEKADPPQQVAGAYLTCAFLDSKADVGQSAVNGKAIPLGCGLFKRGIKSIQPASLANLQTTAAVSCVKKPLRKLATTPSPVANLPLVASVQPTELPCTLQLSVRDKLGKAAIYAKSIPTVTQANALEGFDVNEDMAEQKIDLITAPTTSEGAAASGIKTTAENSALANWLADYVGGSIGADITKANNQNFNGGPILGLTKTPNFIPNLSNASFNSAGVYQGAGGSGGGGGGGSSGGGVGSSGGDNSSSSKLPDNAQAQNKNQQATDTRQKNAELSCTKKDIAKKGQINPGTDSSTGNSSGNLALAEENTSGCKATTPSPGTTSPAPQMSN